jgi:hypothetical protein
MYAHARVPEIRDQMQVCLVRDGMEWPLPSEKGFLHRDFDGVAVVWVIEDLFWDYGVHSREAGDFLEVLRREGKAEAVRVYRVRYRYEGERESQPVGRSLLREKGKEMP